jgi:hypothetical protein
MTVAATTTTDMKDMAAIVINITLLLKGGNRSLPVTRNE